MGRVHLENLGVQKGSVRQLVKSLMISSYEGLLKTQYRHE